MEDKCHQMKTGGENDDEASYMSSERSEYTKDGSLNLKGNLALRQKTGAWRSASFIVASQVSSTLAFWGVGNNLVVYLIEVMHLGNADAANMVSNWAGTADITPLIAAFIAESYLGRFWTSVVLSAVFVLGEVLVTISGSIPSFQPAECERSNLPGTSCQRASTGQMTMLYAGLYVIAMGGGGLQSTLTAFGADQFDEEDEEEKQHKSSFFNWYYAATNFGFMVSVTVLLYLQGRVGYGVGFAMPSVVALLALVTLLTGLPVYRYRILGADAFTRVAQVLVASARNWKIKCPPQAQLHDELHVDDHPKSRRLVHTPHFSLSIAKQLRNQCGVFGIEMGKVGGLKEGQSGLEGGLCIALKSGDGRKIREWSGLKGGKSIALTKGLST